VLISALESSGVMYYKVSESVKVIGSIVKESFKLKNLLQGKNTAKLKDLYGLSMVQRKELADLIRKVTPDMIDAAKNKNESKFLELSKAQGVTASMAVEAGWISKFFGGVAAVLTLLAPAVAQGSDTLPTSVKTDLTTFATQLEDSTMSMEDILNPKGDITTLSPKMDKERIQDQATSVPDRYNPKKDMPGQS